MPRRKRAVEIETLTPEEEQPIRGRKKLVEAEHTIKYSAPVPVTIEESPDDESVNEGDEVFDIEEKPKRKIKNAREELRRKMRANSVTPTSPIKISIEKYLHSESAEGGTWAEKEFCTKYTCAEEHILNEDFVDVMKRWGAGTYRVTIRMENKIVDAYDKRISATPPAASVIQNVIPGDPTSPQFIIQTTGDGPQVAPIPSFKDVMKAQKEAFKEQLEMAKLMREAYGSEAPTQQPSSDPEVALLTFLARDDSVMDKVSKGVLGKILGKPTEERDEWAAVVMEIIKSGQAPQILSSVINSFFNGFGNLIPKGATNGQTEMAAQALEESGPRADGATHQGPTSLDNPQGQQAVQGLHAGLNPGSSETIAATDSAPAPEDQLLSFVLAQCARGVPPNIAVDRILDIRDEFNEMPGQSVDGYLDLFIRVEPTTALEFVRAQGPDGERIAALSYALQWATELQQVLKQKWGALEEAVIK